VTLPLGLTPEAKADLLEARDWYDAQRPGWGAVFVRSADRSFRLRFRSRSGYGDYGKSLRGAPRREKSGHLYFGPTGAEAQPETPICLMFP